MKSSYIAFSCQSRIVGLVWGAVLVALLSAAPGLSSSGLAAEPEGSAPAPSTWGIQIDALDLDAMANSGLDLVVIDTPVHDERQELSTTDVLRLKERLPSVLCYLNIAQADRNQAYGLDWTAETVDLAVRADPEDRAFLDVEFWRKSWRAIVSERVRRIMDMGFDGVYLDAPELWSRHLDRRPGAREDMIDLILYLADETRRRNSRGMVILEDPEDLLKEPEVMDAIDGASMFACMIDPAGKSVAQDVRQRNEDLLDGVLEAGKLALTIEFPRNGEDFRSVADWARERGYLFCAVDESFATLPRSLGAAQE